MIRTSSKNKHKFNTVPEIIRGSMTPVYNVLKVLSGLGSNEIRSVS